MGRPCPHRPGRTPDNRVESPANLWDRLGGTAADRLARPPAPALQPDHATTAAPYGLAVQDGRSAKRAGHRPSAPARQPSPDRPPHSKDGLRPTVSMVAALPPAAPTAGTAAPGCVPSRRRRLN